MKMTKELKANIELGKRNKIIIKELKEDVYRIMNEGSCIVTEQLGNKCIDQLMLIENIETLAKIGKELTQIGFDELGLNWVNLGDNIRVYNAENSDHEAFGIDDFQISYHSQLEIRCKLKDLLKISEYIKRAKVELDRLTESINSRSDKEIEDEKEKMIQKLEKQLSKLKGDSNKKKESK